MSSYGNYLNRLNGTDKKKKKKKEEEEAYAKYMQSFAPKKTDIAPVKKTTTTKKTETKKQDDDGFFKKSNYFADGSWDKGDLINTIRGSVADLGEWFTKGAVGTGEKMVDKLAMLGTVMSNAQMSQLSNDELAFSSLKNIGKDKKTKEKEAESIVKKYNTVQKDAKKGTTEFVKKDLYDEGEIAKKIISAPFEKRTGINPEEASVFGAKSRSLAESTGNMITTKLIGTILGGGMGNIAVGLSAGGGEVEEALKQGATFEGAMASGMITAGAEIAGNQFFNGVKFGGHTLTEGAVQNVARAVSGKTLQTLAKWGINTAGEGAEEVLSDFMSAVGQKLTYLNEKEFNELFSKQDAWDSFLGGMVLGGVFEGVDVASSKITGTDYVTGLTKTEQKVVDKVVEDRIAEEEAKGEELTDKDKEDIRKIVEQELDRGYITTDVIESLFSEEEYKAYKEAYDKEQAVLKEIEELGDKENPTINERKRYEELSESLKELTENRKKLRNQLDTTIAPIIRGNRLAESYRESARSREDFKADYKMFKGSKHEDAARKTIENAIKSKANNSNRVRDLVNMNARFSAETGIVFEYKTAAEITNDFIERQTAEISKIEGIPEAQRTEEQIKELAEMKETLEDVKSGKLKVNGNVTSDSIVINLNSSNVLESISGHEITHLFEKAKSYEKMKEALFSYAKMKGVDIDAEITARKRTYKGVKDSKAEAELVADLIGDYIFTDYAFVEHLANTNRNVFQRLYDSVKHLCKMATAGSKEARELEKVRRNFEKAFNESAKSGVKVKAEENNKSDTQYSITVTDKDTIDFLENQEHITTYKSMQVVDGKLYPPMAAKVKGEDGKYHWGNPSTIGVWQQATEDPANIKKIKNGVGYYTLNKGDGTSIDAAYNPYEHSSNLVLNDQFESAHRRDNLVTVECVIPVSEMSSGYRAEYSKDSTGVMEWKSGVVAGQIKDNKRMVYLSRYLKPVRILSDSETASKYKDILEGTGVSVPFNVVSPSLLAELENAGVDIDYEGSPMYKSIQKRRAEKEAKKKAVKYSLSAEQEEYFKDSKVRDENGNLKVMYHGTSKGGFTTFDTYYTNYGLFGTGSYFTDNKSVAESYTNKGKGDNKQVYESYLNITNPIDMDAEANPEEWAKAFPDVNLPESGTNEKFLREVEDYYSYEEMPKWEVVEIIRDAIQFNMGYDGITHIGGGRFNKKDDTRHRVYIAFEPEQIKNIDNIAPTKDADIRYSLTEDSEGNKLTEKQSEYFANSKVVDRNGNLLKVYHTTKNDFTVFDKARKGEATEDANTYLGFFFSDDAEYMQNFPEFEGGKTESYYLDMKNPIDMTDISEEAFLDIVEVMGGDIDEAAEVYAEAKDNGSLQLGHLFMDLTGEFSYNDFITELKPHYDELMSKGYDGVVGFLDEGYGVKEYIVLDSHQAKLTSNKNPSADADVRYSITTEKTPQAKTRKTMKPTNSNLQKDMWSVRDVRSKTMLENNYTQADVEQINKFMDNLATFMEKAGVTYKFIGLEDVNNAKVKVVYDTDGTPKRITMSAMVKNGEYPVNFDFTTICKKRQSMSMVIEELARRKNGDGTRELDEIDLDAKALWTINEELRKAGLETACLGCFVESKRYNIQNFANKATTMWNSIVDEIRQEQGNTQPVEKFNFAEGIDLEKVNYSKVDKIFRAYRDVKGRTSPEKRMRALIKNGGEVYQKYLQPSDLMTPEGIEGLKSLSTNKNDFYGIIKGVYGQAAPKEVMSFSPYNSEIALLPDKKGKNMKMAEYIAKIGGVRMQSFSDFIVSNVYDYMQMVADLSAKHLPAHAYTKEIAFAKIFGKTGIKINMSVMFDIDASLSDDYAGLQFVPDANGTEEYEGVKGRFEYLVADQKRSDKVLAEAGERPYVQSIGFDEAVKLQNTEGYSGNIGIIGVGYSDNHIIKMLRDNNIRYVIPYHSSSLPAEIKAVTNISKANDYTEYQNTKTKNGDALIGLGGFDIYKDVAKTKNPKQTAQNYLDYCKSKNYTPVFPQFAAEENYYKLLFDFDPYDTITGEYSPQTEVKNIYEGYNAEEGLTSTKEIERLIEEEMKIQNEANRQRNTKISDVVDSVLEQLGVENDKVGFSLSEEGQKSFVPYGRSGLHGSDFTVQNDIAPSVTEGTSKTEQVGTVNEDDYAPMTEAEALRNAEADREALNSLTDADMPPEMDAPIYDRAEEGYVPESPLEDRDINEVGNRKVKAYMYENPEVKPFFQEAAQDMLYDLTHTAKGERRFNDELYYESGGELGWMGTKRHTTPEIADLLDNWKYTYADIERGLRAIIEDNGAENNAVSKRIEFALDEMLRNGYTGIYDEEMPPNQEYINLLIGKEITEYNDEAFNYWVSTLTEDDFMSESVVQEEIAPTREYEAIKPRPDVLSAEEKQWAKNKMARADKGNVEQPTAKILTEEPKVNKKKNTAWSKFKTNFVDKAHPFETLSLKTGNREVDAKFNSIRYADSKAQNLIGKGAEGVKALKDIQTEVEKDGLTQALYEYLYHKHNVDRMTLEDRYDDVPNKAVFGNSVTAEASQDIVNQYEFAEPKLKEYAQEIYNYNKHLRKLLVDGGVISQETADLWEEMYPHYVPIRRAGDEGLNINVALDTNRTGVNAPIKRATGGNRDILPLFDTMAQRTLQTYKAVSKNRFGVELKNTLGTTIESTKTSLDEVIDSIDAQEGLLQEGKNGRNPTFTVFENGKRVTFEITDEMYDALKPTSEGLAYTNKVLNKGTNIFRGLVTEFNPTFMLTNAIKDAQDVLINSQHSARTYKNFPKAIKELASKGKWYTEYMENGGADNTYFDKETNDFTGEKSRLSKVIGFPFEKISEANNFIERIPRLAEYIASRESGRSIDVSMLDSARVTTNFAAGGDVTKFLNRNGATFLNASVQGATQNVRNIREAKANGLKGWVHLATKVALAGLPSILLNNLLWDDDEEYEELSEYVKKNYYVVAKTQNGKFVRIPKGRAVAVIQNAFEQVQNAVTGDDEVDLKSFLELAVSNLAPNNPIDNNIIAPIMQVANNETWYGEDLVPTRLKDLPAKEQYDESTDEISKWLGEKINVSPYKINYLLNQYSGGVGDVVLPMFTPEAESGDKSFFTAPLRDKFTTDSVLNNKNPSDFYTTKEELTVKANSKDATDEDVLKSKYINSVNTELSDLYKEKREIQNSNLSDDLKFKQVRDIQKQINDISRNALNTYENVKVTGRYANIGDRHYMLNNENEWQKITDEQLEKQNEAIGILGITPSQYWSNKQEYDMAAFYPEKYAVLQEEGISVKDYKENYEESAFIYTDDYSWASNNPTKYAVSKAVADDLTEYREYTSALNEIKGDGAKEKKKAYIWSLPIDEGQKMILFRSIYSAKKDKSAYNRKIVNYLESRDDISYDEMFDILEELDFTVDRDTGYYSW